MPLILIVGIFVVALQVMALRRRSVNRLPVGSVPRAGGGTRDRRRFSRGNGYQRPEPCKRVHRCRSRDHRYGCTASDHREGPWTVSDFPATERFLFFSMGTRLIFLLRAAVPLNFSLVQNLTAALTALAPHLPETLLPDGALRLPYNARASLV
jgi:hypothetical protein